MQCTLADGRSAAGCGSLSLRARPDNNFRKTRASKGILNLFVRQPALKTVLSRIRRDARRIVACKTSAAKRAVFGERFQFSRRQVPKRVRAEDGGDFNRGVPACDQVVFRVNIRPVIAGVQKWRRRDTQMYLFRAGFPQQFDNTAACGASDNGVVDQYDAFARNGGFDCGKLDF